MGITLKREDGRGGNIATMKLRLSNQISSLSRLSTTCQDWHNYFFLPSKLKKKCDLNNRKRYSDLKKLNFDLKTIILDL